MTVLVMFALFAAYFLYMKQWAKSFLLREYNFASPRPPQPIPHSPAVSALVAMMWGFLLIGSVDLGFTYDGYSGHLAVRGDDAETVLLVLLPIALGLSYFVAYRLGEIRGVANMKNTQLFITGMRVKQ